MLKKLLLALVLSASVTLVYSAATPVAQCGETTGYSYFPGQQSQFTKEHWMADGFRDGTITLVQLANGSLDVVIYNNPRQTTFSTVADGGRVIVLRKTAEDLVVMAWYPTTTEVYTFIQTSAGGRVSVLGTRNQMRVRTSMFTGSCRYLNINALQ